MSVSKSTYTGALEHVPETPAAVPGILRQDVRGAIAVLCLAAADLAGFFSSFSLAVLVRLHLLPALSGMFPRGVPEQLFDYLWVMGLIGAICFTYEGLYTRRFPFWRETKRVIKAATLAFFLVLGIVSLGKLSSEVSRTVLVLGYVISLFALPLWRLAGKTALLKLGLWDKPVLILGAGKTGELAASALLREKLLGYRIAGFLDDDLAKKAGLQINGRRFKILGGFRDAERVMAETGVRHLIVAAPGMPGAALVKLVNRLQRRAASLVVIPDLFGVPVMSAEADYFFDEQVLSFRLRNNLASPWNMLAKRTFDLAAGLIILLVSAPVLILIALAIKLDSPGPVFFTHRRIGRGGKEFNCYKFRTMYLNNEQILKKHLEANPEAKRQWAKYAKLKDNDPRITHIGRLLRKFSLDELPQIFNVLKGEMSLAGPRPYLPREIEKLHNHADSILLARPGITGLWQVSGRNEIDFEGRLQLDSWYVRNWSLWLDITLLIRTVGVVFSRRGAY